jgi:hypothetical protein
VLLRLAYRHQITVLQRQLGSKKVQSAAATRAFLAALLHQLPHKVLRTLRLLIRPDTVLCRHRPHRCLCATNQGIKAVFENGIASPQ